MRTLVVTREIERSLVGEALLGARHQNVQIAKLIPVINGAEDAESLVRCHFLDPSVPFEINLLCAASMRTRLDLRRFDVEGTGDTLRPDRLLPTHPIIGYVPPEVWTSPNSVALHRLEASSPTGSRISKMRLVSNRKETTDVGWEDVRRKAMVGDATFWAHVSQDPRLYDALLQELRVSGSKVMASLIAPPVPVLSSRFKLSPEFQRDFNLRAVSLLAPNAKESRGPGALYSFHLHPGSIRDAGLIQRALQLMDHSIQADGDRFWGVHISFTDTSLLSNGGASSRNAAREVVAEVSRIARSKGLFTWVSNVGIPGAALLDEGAAFCSYPPNLNPRRVYSVFDGGERADSVEDEDDEGRSERMYGKIVNGPWLLTLMDFIDLRNAKWRVQPNGRTPEEVPLNLRTGPHHKFRVEFAKPNNVGCMERLNEERERELITNGNAQPGRHTVRRSEDGRTSSWG